MSVVAAAFVSPEEPGMAISAIATRHASVRHHASDAGPKPSPRRTQPPTAARGG
ncbi:hypothetical protein [Kaistia soli]|uniref:hypothetical protein n=1 Tax=Kaistia soli TaxID=446684 RepID=UPI001AEC8340|nr:hypothetical protein [Kaistia soli]